MTVLRICCTIDHPFYCYSLGLLPRSSTFSFVVHDLVWTIWGGIVHTFGHNLLGLWMERGGLLRSESALISPHKPPRDALSRRRSKDPSFIQVKVRQGASQANMTLPLNTFLSN